jgi:tetratricopeptide (TPR) repeat protein
MSKKNILELCMIVKNGSTTIRNVLNSVKDSIDSWSILDTGSSDGTQEIIKECMKDIPGTLYEESFVDFSSCRNKIMSLAGKKCKYVLMLDDSHEFTGIKNLRDVLENSNIRSYSIPVYNKNNNLVYQSRIVLRTTANLKYTHKIRECIYDKNKATKTDKEVYILDIEDSIHMERSNKRVKNDTKILLEEHKKNTMDLRPIYHLIKISQDSSDKEKYCDIFLNALRKNLNKNKNKEINIHELYECYLEIARIYTDLNKPWKEIEIFYSRAYQTCQFRAEPLYMIACYYFKEGNFDYAGELLSKIFQYPVPDIEYKIDHTVYKFEIPFLYANVLLKKGMKKEAISLLQELQKIYPNSTDINTLLDEYEEVNDKIITFNTPAMVIYDGRDLKWNTETMEKDIQNELLPLKVLGEFSNFGFKTIFFCDCEGFEGTRLGGVQFKHLSGYSSFMKNYRIDVLVVIENSEKLVYRENTNKVYLWNINGLLTGNSFQTHQTKFKGIVCSTELQKNSLCKSYKFPETMLDVLDTNNSVEKIAKGWLRFFKKK